MIIAEYILLALLLICAVFIVIAVTLQKSGDKGLSGTIAGSAASETYYGKDKGPSREKIIAKWVLIAAVVFAVAVLVVYVIQPDYTHTENFDYWKNLTEYNTSVFD